MIVSDSRITDPNGKTLRLHPLGDRCCYWIYCYQLHLMHLKKVKIMYFKDLNFFQKIYNTSEVDHNFKDIITDEIHYNTLKSEKLWKNYKDHPKATNIQKPVDMTDIHIPKKYVVCQWDAQQQYRVIEEDRKQKIMNFYRELGYEFVVIGGQASNMRMKLDLNAIAYVISKADYFVGADSGMMNLSKLILPIDRIHSYVNLNWESTNNNKHDRRLTRDGRSISGCIRSSYVMGAPINYCENLDNPMDYSKHQREYV